MSYDKNEVKEYIEIEDVYTLLDSLGAEPQIFNNTIISLTICHGGDSHKLYYYDNTQLFKCYTGDCGYFDIFDLVSKVRQIDLNEAIVYIVNLFNLHHKVNEVEEQSLQEDWKFLQRYNKILSLDINNNKIVLPEINEHILDYYPQPNYSNWEKEHISKEICDYMNIRYDPVHGGILIPHYDENDRMVGIRIRTLIQEEEEKGKYRPAILQNKMWNHPLGFNLYGLTESKNNIKDTGVAIVVEGEKSVLQIMSYLGTENNIAVAMCGNSLSAYQFRLLQECGAQEIVISLDKDFHELGDESFYETVKKIEKINNKYKDYCNISFMFDKLNLLGYKDSASDKGKEIFFELWRNRITV